MHEAGPREPDEPRPARRAAAVTFLAVASLLFVMDLLLVAGPEWGEDVAQHWVASRLFVEGRNPYEPGALRAGGEAAGLIAPGAPSHHFLERHHYPPLGLLVGLPLSRLDYGAARLAWLSVSTLTALACIPLLLRASGLEFRSEAGLLLVGAFLTFLPLKGALGLGQPDVVLFLLLLLAVDLDRRGRPASAGFALATALLLKLIPAAWILAFAAYRRYRTTAAAVGWSIAITAGSLLAIPVSFYGAFLRDQASFMSAAEGWQRYEPTNLSWTAWVAKAFAFASGSHALEPIAVAVGRGLALAVLGAVLLVLARRGRGGAPPEPAGVGLLCAAVALVSPLTWQHHLVPLVLPLGVALRETLSTAGPSRFASRFLIPFLLVGVLDPRLAAWRRLTATWPEASREAAWALPALAASAGIAAVAWSAWRSLAATDRTERGDGGR